MQCYGQKISICDVYRGTKKHPKGNNPMKGKTKFIHLYIDSFILSRFANCIAHLTMYMLSTSFPWIIFSRAHSHLSDEKCQSFVFVDIQETYFSPSLLIFWLDVSSRPQAQLMFLAFSLFLSSA